MKIVVFLLVILKMSSAFLISDSSKIHEILNEAWNTPSRRIIGGSPANENQFPFMVVLIIFNIPGSLLCSAFLIKPNLVLTAAHCTINRSPENSIVIGGQANYTLYYQRRKHYPARAKFDYASYNLEERWPSIFYTHPGYKSDKELHDIALVQLQQPFTSPNITTIPLSLEKMERPMFCTILGWGTTETGHGGSVLHYGYAIAKPSDWGCEFITDGPVLCLEKGLPVPCRGDSGSPLVCKDKVWGVGAFLHDPEKKNKCEGLESFYTEIYPKLEWIENPTTASTSIVATSKHTFFPLIFAYYFYLKNSLYIYII